MKTLTNNLRLFWQGALLSYIALFHWIRPAQYVASKILMPLAQMFFFVYLGTYANGHGTPAFTSSATRSRSRRSAASSG